MQYTLLGRSGLKVSRAALGTMNFGIGPDAPCGEPEARRIIGAFLDAGGTLIDTANIYTGGRSEEVVGRAIATRRDSVVLATKGSGPLGAGPNDRGLSRLHLTRALEGSLRRLGTDYIDLYQCHNWDPDTPIEETMATLDSFVRSGKVRYVGCSNYTAGQIIESQWASQRLGTTPFISLQPHYSLLAREIEAEILPACARHGLGTLTYGPLAGGMLAGRYRRGRQPDPGTRLHQWLAFNPTAASWATTLLREECFDIADEVTQVADLVGATPSAIAIAWTVARPGITSVILGPRTVDQLTDNLTGIDLSLAADLVDQLNTVSAPANAPVTGLPVTLPTAA
ncbi:MULTISPECIES: aldo/keto reductase [unclassified Frankia]|uniref:aldo/keto reductase n=1 Tax=unclassified Frankia TaxID=2632575 RepID=UPI002AD48DD6|nr:MULTISPECIES: aldo/keto reductase [unclassified Frankia]